MSVFFPTFHRSLIIDTRFNSDTGPFIKLMPMARSPQDRMRSIRRLRPQFPRPSNLTLIPLAAVRGQPGRIRRLGAYRATRVRESGDRDAMDSLRSGPEYPATHGAG